MTAHAKGKPTPWILAGPKARVEFQVPKALRDLFDQRFPNRTEKLTELMLKALPELKDTTSVADLKHRNPTHWFEKDLVCRNAILLKLGENIQRGSIDPTTFNQLMELGFQAEQELQNSQMKGEDDAEPS